MARLLSGRPYRSVRGKLKEYANIKKSDLRRFS
jgi:hypothetical protein